MSAARRTAHQPRRRTNTHRALPTSPPLDASHRPILVDHQGGSGFLTDLPPLTSLSRLARLHSADCCFIGRHPATGRRTVLVGIEVKSIGDLLSSCQTGRLQDTQLAKMLSEYEVRWLVYYGQYRVTRDGYLQVWWMPPAAGPQRQQQAGSRRAITIPGGAGASTTAAAAPSGRWINCRFGSSDRARQVPYTYLADRLLELHDAGVATWRCHDAAEAAQWVGALWRYWDKPPAERGDGLRMFDKSRDGGLIPNVNMTAHQVAAARVLAKLPGVGYKRAVALVERAAALPGRVSTRDVLNQSREEWAEAEGVGKVIARTVDEFLEAAL